MNRIAFRADFFDASALAKVFTSEPGSDIVREYWRSRATKYTTPFCFYEAMNVLKGKYKHKGKLTVAQYFNATFELTGTPTGDLHPISSRPCWAHTIRSSRRAPGYALRARLTSNVGRHKKPVPAIITPS